jgi:hypothetical protein
VAWANNFRNHYLPGKGMSFGVQSKGRQVNPHNAFPIAGILSRYRAFLIFGSELSGVVRD